MKNKIRITEDWVTPKGTVHEGTEIEKDINGEYVYKQNDETLLKCSQGVLYMIEQNIVEAFKFEYI